MFFVSYVNSKTQMVLTAATIQRTILKSYEEELLLTRPDNLKDLENDEYLMVVLSQNNSKIVEYCIKHDPAYQFR